MMRMGLPPFRSSPVKFVGWKTFPKATKRNEMAEDLPEKCQLRLSAHLCSFREGQQHNLTTFCLHSQTKGIQKPWRDAQGF
jgi:hypothetical protein